MSTLINIDGVAYPAPDASDMGSWAARQVAVEQALAAAINATSGYNPGTWIDIPLNVGQWTGNCQYRQDSSGDVYCRGTATSVNGTNPLIGTIPLPNLGPLLFPTTTANAGTGPGVIGSEPSAGQTQLLLFALPIGGDFHLPISLDQVNWSTT